MSTVEGPVGMLILITPKNRRSYYSIYSEDRSSMSIVRWTLMAKVRQSSLELRVWVDTADGYLESYQHG